MYTQGPFQGIFSYLFPYTNIGQPPIPGSGWGRFPGAPGGGFPGAPGGDLPPRPPGFVLPGSQPPGPPPGFGPGVGQDGPPPGPPPSTIPQQQTIGTFAVDPGSLFGCLRRYTYMRLEDGSRFWFWPTFIGRTSVAGYRWIPWQQRWIYTGFDTRLILSFQCY
ncbi:MAG: hypothetical protein LRY73_01130 [Bacillus sp. (in: Bacteria)]|nr:hypothetical protein [Bacillus sp. (in: firmicutes)]